MSMTKVMNYHMLNLLYQKIAETQTILSHYYDASKMVLEKEIERINRNEISKPWRVIMHEDGELYWDDESKGLPSLVV